MEPEQLTMRLGKGAAAILAGLGLLASGCDLDSMKLGVGGSSAPAAATPVPPAVSDLDCRAKDGKIGLSWGAVSGAYAYRVSRSEGDAPPVDLGQATSGAYTDYGVSPGVAYAYRVTPIGVDGDGPTAGPCTVSAPSPDGPPSPQGVACRAKDGKVDVTWNAVSGASIYRVFRTGGGQARTQVSETTGRVHADVALQNGFQYGYDVVAVDGRGRASAASDLCNATPGPRITGNAPPVVTNLACRGKNDKADITFTPAPGAAFHRIFRSDSGAAAAAIGETVGGVFVQSGLAIGTRYEFSVESVGPGGANSARSPICALTASGRGTGVVNEPPVITSQPLTSALEDHVYFTTIVATDPEGAPVSYSLVKGPPGMELDPTSGLLRWIPDRTQLGPQTVEVRAADPPGAADVQAFVIDAADFDEPPSITSVPGRYARAGETYAYDVDAFDPEGRTLTYAFGAPVPAGMTIDASTGLVSFMPMASDAGTPTIVVRAVDPAGGFATQPYVLNVAATPLDLVAPGGEVEIEPGETVDLLLVANQPQAGFGVEPMLENAALEGNRFRFTPDADQIGDFDLGFRAVIGDQQDVNLVTIKVRAENHPPELAPVAPVQIREGESIDIPIQASDPDGDPLVLRAPGLALPNAVFDEIGRKLLFAPNFEQAGTYLVTVSASDARETVETQLSIEVVEAEPPADLTELVVDPVKSPTFAPSQTISGSIRGEIRPGQVGTSPFLVGLSPVSVRQGRRVTVEITGLHTAFAAGEVSVDFGSGIVVESVEVVSPTSARVVLGAYSDAEVGPRAVRASQPSGDAPSVVAFSVEPGAATLSGVLIDSFTQQPIVGARVAIQGLSGVSAVTDAQGRYALDGVPPGDQTVVVASANYAVARFSLGFSPNTPVDLGSTVTLSALARPFSAGGTLPRSATIASVLDRGMNLPESDLSYDQIRAGVIDTLLAIGGPTVGVLDEAGNQLNAEFLAPGMLNLSPAGIDFLAERLSLGESYSLEEVVFLLVGTFGWIFPDLRVETVLAHMQDMVNLAWAAPAHPTSAELIFLFNEGRTLDAKPPRLSPETRVNSFQAFLLAMGFLSKNFDNLNDAVDQMLVLQGKDPAAVLRQYGYDPELYALGSGPTPWQSFAQSGVVAFNAIADAAFGHRAHAAEGPGQQPPNTVKRPTLTRRIGSGFSNVFNVNSIVGAIFAGIVGFAVAGFFAMCGLFGGLAAFGVGAALAAFGASFLSALLAKLVVGFLTADQELTMVPQPVPAISAQDVTYEGQEKVRIRFQKSQTELDRDSKIEGNETYVNEFGEIANVLSANTVDPRYLDFRYHLWRVPPPPEKPVLGAPGSQLVSTRAQPVSGKPNEQQFVLPAKLLDEGENYFVIVTVQFYRRLFSVDPDEPQFRLLYPDLGVPPPPPNPLGAAGTTGVPQNVTASLPKPFHLEIDFNDKEAFFEQKRLEAEQRAEQARESARRNAEEIRQQLPELETEATTKSNQAAELRTTRAEQEALLKDLREQLRQAAPVDPLVAKQNWRSTLNAVLDDPAFVMQTEEDLLEQMRNPATPLGQRTADAAAQFGGVEALERVAIFERRAKVAEASRALVTDARAKVDAGRKRLVAAIDAVAGGAPEAALGGDAVDVPTLSADNPPRVVGAEPRALPAAVNPENLEAARELLETLDQDVASLGAQAKSLAAGKGGRTAALNGANKALDNIVVPPPSQDALEAIQKQIETTDAGYRSTGQEIENLEKEAGRLRDEALQRAERAAEQEALSLPPKPTPSGPKTIWQKIGYEGIDRTKPGGRYKFGVGASEAFGVVADIGIESFGARNNVLVMRSQVSNRIQVTKSSGQFVLPPPDQVLAALQRGETFERVVHALELGPVAPDGLPPGARRARSLLGPLNVEGPITDAGVPAGIDPIRWRRRVEALQRHGWLPGPAGTKASTGYAIPFEIDPTSSNILSLLHPTPPSGPTGKEGFLVRDYPFTAARASKLGAGFPSDLIAVDYGGQIYLENLNSNATFGGRIFRFFGTPVTREHVGSVSYWSSSLQYARPTQPVAMEIAEGVEGDAVVEDLFVAELDPGVYINPAIQPENRILRVATSLADRNPAYANGQNRNRIVGQPYATHPDFQMTGPSDLERDRIARFGDGPLYLYFSDEENVFVIRDTNRDGVGEVGKVLSVPGRRFAGLAIDAGGNLLVVDHAAGELFLLPSFELNVILASGNPITTDTDLDTRAFLLKPGLRGPSDVESDTWEERYIVSTDDGFEVFDMPLVGRLAPDTLDVKFDIRGRELPVTLRRDRGNMFLVASASDAPLGRDVKMRVKKRDPTTGEIAWEERIFLNSPFGVSVLPGVL